MLLEELFLAILAVKHVRNLGLQLGDSLKNHGFRGKPAS
jgi:hypothetical protein